MGKHITNPDGLFVRALKKRIKSNNGFCPNKLEKIPDNKCPCKDFRENENCDCGLYINISWEQDDEQQIEELD